MSLNLFELEAVLRLNTQQYNQSISEAEQEGTSFIQRLGNTWTSVKSKFQVVSHLVQPVTDLVNSATDLYAEYQQMAGGLEQIFGDTADDIIARSKRAYRTAGLSMNEYMNMVISTGAKLLNDLGGDTQAAADLSDQAIIQMGDAVNAMGISWESAMNAYSGFSRGVYTMLDNLHLGYAGTAEEARRLVEDAMQYYEEATGEQIELQFGNYADFVRAIGIVQEHLGIAGTTQREGTGTISGSNASMKAMWENLKTIMANPNTTQEEIDETSRAFSQALGTWLQNIMPIIRQVLTSLISAMQEILSTPEAGEFIVELVRTFVSTLVTVLPQIVSAIGELFRDPVFRASLLELVVAIVDGIKTIFAGGANNLARETIDAIFGEGTYDRQIVPILDPTGRLGLAETPETPTNAAGGQVSSGTLLAAAAGSSSGGNGIAYWNRPEGNDTGYSPYVHVREETLNAWRNAIPILQQMLGTTLTNAQVQSLVDANVIWPESMNSAELDVSTATVDANTVTFANGARYTFNVETLEAIVNGGEASPHAKGLWSVPRDDYLARLHRDEMILTATEARAYRSGQLGGNSDIVAEIQGLRNDIQNIKMVVGQRVFGETVVDYSGKRMSGYIGQAENRQYAGYGWG